MKTSVGVAILAAALLVPDLPAAAGEAQPASGQPDTAAAVAGNNAFALDLYGLLRAQPGNLFFSPYSISVALAMTYGGARGQTAEQMAQALRFTLEPEALHAAQGALMQSLNDPARAEHYQLAVANSLWGQRGYGFLPEFLALTGERYGAPLHEVDYVAAAEAARQEINAWVLERTREKIRDLIPAGVLDELTRLVLVNAIYFKGDWARQFKVAATQEQPFHAAGGRQAPVPLMYQRENFRYAEDENLQALALPYVGEELEMAILLPRAVDGLAALEEGLTAERLAGWLGRLGERRVEVYLPRFKLEPEGLDLVPHFQALGMSDAFRSPEADFSGINGHSGNDPEALHISAIIHKAFVEVNEEGTEAAAATAVVMGHATSAELPPPTPVFRADHPFLFLIRERATGSILFMGRLAEAPAVAAPAPAGGGGGEGEQAPPRKRPAA